MLYVILFLAGLVVGFLITSAVVMSKTSGEIVFYDAEPGEPPAMIAELDVPVDDICKQTRVVFRISRR